MVYTISLGSNEHRAYNLDLARKRLSALFPQIRFSPVEETKPLNLSRPALFSNQLARFTSDYTSAEVERVLKRIEQEAGRLPEEKKQEIVKLDLDLLLCGDCVCRPQDMERDYIRRGLASLDAGEQQCKEK